MRQNKISKSYEDNAYKILNELLSCGLWDPVVTSLMTDTQCANMFYKAVKEYFKSHKMLVFWDEDAAYGLLDENTEIIQMMRHYNFHKYQDKIKGHN